MGQTWRIVAALLLTFAFTAQCSECRLLQQTLLGMASSESPAIVYHLAVTITTEARFSRNKRVHQ